jgi:hypothetical protein
MAEITEIVEIVEIFNQNQKLDFIDYLKQNSSKKDLKIIQLFQLISSKKLTKDEIIIQLYGKSKKEAFYSLNKRLTQLLIKYLSTTELSEEDEILSEYNKYLLAGKKLLRYKIYDTGFKLLKKAENIALEEDNYSCLNDIYLILIQLNHYNKACSLQHEIKKFEENEVLYKKEIQLKLAYAQIKNEVSSFIKNGTSYSIEKIIESCYQKFHISENTQYSFKTLYQLAQIYYSHATILRDYYSIESYIISQYKTIFRKSANKSKSLLYQVKLLYVLASLYFQRKEFNSSRKYCEKLLYIIENSKEHSIKIIEFKTIILKALVENYSGYNDKAIILLKSHLYSLTETDIKNRLDANCVLALFSFHKKEYKLAKSTFNDFQETDYYYMELMGREWVMRKNLIEILLHIELKEYDYVDSRIKSFFRVNKDYLEKHGRVKNFMLLVKKIYPDSNSINETLLYKQKIQTTLNKKPRLREDIFVLSFFAWLKAKVEDKDLYKLTLELVNSLEKEEKTTLLA